jgi:hypothetical protein
MGEKLYVNPQMAVARTSWVDVLVIIAER